MLTAAGTAASFGGLLWKAYDRLIAPVKDDTDNGGIVLIIGKDNGTSDQFWIGNTHRDRAAFIEEFTHKVETIRQSDVAGGLTEHVVEEIHVGSQWVRRE